MQDTLVVEHLSEYLRSKELVLEFITALEKEDRNSLERFNRHLFAQESIVLQELDANGNKTKVFQTIFVRNNHVEVFLKTYLNEIAGQGSLDYILAHIENLLNMNVDKPNKLVGALPSASSIVGLFHKLLINLDLKLVDESHAVKVKNIIDFIDRNYVIAKPRTLEEA